MSIQTNNVSESNTHNLEPNSVYSLTVAESECHSPTPKFNRTLFSWLDNNFEKIFLIFGLLSIIFFITLQTGYRYIVTGIFKSAGALVWTEEIARYFFVWISYLALSIAIKQRTSIRVDIIYDMLPKRWQKITMVTVDCCFLLFTLILLMTGWTQIERLLQFPQTTVAMGISFLIPYAILPFGFGLMSIRVMQCLYLSFKDTGVQDGIRGVILFFLLWLPLYPILSALYLPDMPIWYDYIPPVPVLFGYFILLCLVGVPIAISLGIASITTVICADTLPLEYIGQTAFTAIDSFPIMAIPFFIAAGVFMGAGGLSSRLLKFADEMLGGLHGGMALTTVATCMFFGAISGSGPATVAAIGSLTIPAMVDRGYNKLFAASLVAAAGAIGVMIPPSNPFVVYGVSAQVSIGDLFIGGIVPGLLTGLLLMGYAYFHSRRQGWRGEQKERTFKSVFQAFWDAKWAMFVPVIVLGGIYGGFMTPTEAAAVAALYGLIVGMFVYREIDICSLCESCVVAAETSATIIILMAMATIFGNIMTMEDVPGIIARTILEITNNPLVILLLMNILLLIVGVFMEALAAIVILTPILLPVVVGVGVSPLHFGIIMVVNLAIGFITPPVGVNLFVASSVAKAKISELTVHVLPMIALMLLVLLLITYVPSVPLFFVK